MIPERSSQDPRGRSPRGPRPALAARVAGGLALVSLALAPLARAQGPHQLSLHEELVFPAGQDTASVPFQDVGGHIQVPVSVNGGEPFWMVFDTGMPSPGVLLYGSPRVDALQLPYGEAQIRVGGAGGAGEATAAKLAQDVTVKLGALAITGTMAIVMPAKPEMSAVHEGIIGASLYRNATITVDRDRGVVRFTRLGRYQPPAGAAVVPLELVGNHAYVQAGLVQDGGTLPLRLILDLGATHAVSLNSHTNPAIHVPAGARVARVGRGMSGVLRGRVGRIAGFELGGQRLANVVATFPDSAFENPRGLDSRDGNLGSGILARFELTLDYANAKLYLRPSRRFADAFEWDMSGVTFDPGPDGTPTVAEVIADSPAGRAGISAGEQLVAVDGKPVQARSLMLMREQFKQPGREIVLRLRKGGAERDVKLKLQRLV